MTIVSEIRLTVSHTVNLGNYNSTKIEGTVVVGRSDESDTALKMRDEALVEMQQLLDEAKSDHLPKRRSGSKSDED